MQFTMRTLLKRNISAVKKKIINFEDILNELDKDDVLIFNNTKVMPSIILSMFVAMIKMFLISIGNHFSVGVVLKHSKFMIMMF